jgi:hypothetical protein
VKNQNGQKTGGKPGDAIGNGKSFPSARQNAVHGFSLN